MSRPQTVAVAMGMLIKIRDIKIHYRKGYDSPLYVALMPFCMRLPQQAQKKKINVSYPG